LREAVSSLGEKSDGSSDVPTIMVHGYFSHITSIPMHPVAEAIEMDTVVIVTTLLSAPSSLINSYLIHS
jgi:hypothetical protein